MSVMYLSKLINTFHKEHLEKPTATSLSLDSTLPMTKLTVTKDPKQKHGRPSKTANKRKKNQPFVTPDFDIMLKILICNICIFCSHGPYFLPEFPKISSLFSINIRFSSPFSQLGFGDFLFLIEQQMIDFLTHFLIKFCKFFINRPLDFLPYFLMKFKKFFTN